MNNDEYWDQVEREVGAIKSAAVQGKNKSLLLTYVSAIDLRLTQVIQKVFISGEDSNLLLSSDSSSLDFSQKIELAYRMGLISSTMKESLAALRKLRNSAAHTEDDIDLQNGAVSSKIDHLYKGLSDDTRDTFPAETVQDKLETFCALLIQHFIHRRNIEDPTAPRGLEQPFSYIRTKTQKKK